MQATEVRAPSLLRLSYLLNTYPSRIANGELPAPPPSPAEPVLGHSLGAQPPAAERSTLRSRTDPAAIRMQVMPGHWPYAGLRCSEWGGGSGYLNDIIPCYATLLSRVACVLQL